MLVYLHGNCQARAIAQMLAPVFPEWDVAWYEVFDQKIIEENHHYRSIVASADIIITQPVHRGYRGRDDLSLDWVQSAAKPSARVVTFPSMYFSGQLLGWTSLSIPGYGMPYHDSMLLKMALSDSTLEEITKALLSPELYDEDLIAEEIERSIAEIERREQEDGVDVALSPFIRRFVMCGPLFHVINHPCRPALAHVANKVLAHLGYTRPVPELGEDHLKYPHVPGSPSVAKFLAQRGKDIPAWHIEDGERYQLPGESICRENYIAKAVKHLRGHEPEVLQSCIRDHRAQSFLHRVELAAKAKAQGHIAFPQMTTAPHERRMTAKQHVERSRAMLADGRQPEAVSAAQQAIESDATWLEAASWLGHVLRNCGDLSGAESAFREALRLAPSSAHDCNELGLVLSELGRHQEGIAWCRRAVALQPENPFRRIQLHHLLVRANDLAAAEHEVRTAIQMQSSELDFRLDLARILLRTARYGEALRELFQATEQEAAANERQSSAARQLLCQVSAAILHDTEPDQIAPGDLAFRFESLGGSGHGSEFGIFQQTKGADPVGLLRWADLDYNYLVAALEARFEGVGEPEHTIVFHPDNGSDEWWTRDRRYWMAMRTFIKVADVPYERMVESVTRNQLFLRRKIIDDLETGTKTFVYKNMWRNLSDAELERLRLALRSFGDATLLYIRYSDEAHPCGSVEWRGPGLLVGYIDHFAFSPTNEKLEFPEEQFLTLCSRAALMRDLWDRTQGKSATPNSPSEGSVREAMPRSSLGLGRGGGRRKRMACLVMAKTAPRVLAQATEIYTDCEWDVFVHLDARSDSEDYRRQMGPSARQVRFLDAPFNVFWGGFSMVEAEIALIEGALHHGGYDKFLFLTDDTFPVRRMRDLVELSGPQQPDRIMMHSVKPGSPFERRYKDFFFYDHVATNPRGYGDRVIDDKFIRAMRRLEELRLRGKPQISLHWGFAYWCLSCETIDRVLSAYYADDALREAFRFSAQPDEMIFQSLIAMTVDTRSTENGPVFMDFSQNPGPRTFNSFSELPPALPKHAYFVRKLSANADVESFAAGLKLDLSKALTSA